MPNNITREVSNIKGAGLKTRDELDGMVVNMELTLISIIQGVALYFLSDSSRMPITTLQVSTLPYIVAGLLIILLFWSRSLIHTFTVIRWPLEFGHNFGYIACTLVEAIWFTQLANVRNWYIFGAIYAAMIWFLFGFDLRMIRRRVQESSSPTGLVLFTTLEAEQLLHVRFGMPSVTLFYAVAAALAILRPDWFVNEGLHLVFAALQLLAAVIYLLYVLGFFRRISPLVLGYRTERER
jgi:hypothetical protein